MNIACSAVSLRELPLFSSLTEAERTFIQPLSEIRNYPAGCEIIKRGDAVDGIYLLLAGTVDVLLADARGHKVIVDTLRENETFSELGLFQETSSQLTFACARACQVLHVPRAALLDALNENCRLAAFIARALAHRLEHSYRKLGFLAHDDVYARVLDIVLTHGHEKDGSWYCDLGAGAMSSMVAASREMVSRVTKDLVRRGLVRRHKRKLVASDRSELEQWAVQRRKTPTERKHAAAPAGPIASMELAIAAT